MKNNIVKNNKQCVIIHYADILKFVLFKYFNWNGKKDQEGRDLLQKIGTDVGRKNNPDLWVNLVKMLVDNIFYDKDYILIPDARFENEIDLWKDYGYDIVSIKVIRSGYKSSLTNEQLSHESETALDNHFFDYVVISDTIKDLKYYINIIYDDIEHNYKER